MSKKKRRNPAADLTETQLQSLMLEGVSVVLTKRILSGSAGFKIRVEPSMPLDHLSSALANLSIEIWSEGACLASCPLHQIPVAGGRKP